LKEAMNFEKHFIGVVCSFALTDQWITENSSSVCPVEGTQVYMSEKMELISFSEKKMKTISFLLFITTSTMP
jgi:hypothetical protein